MLKKHSEAIKKKGKRSNYAVSKGNVVEFMTSHRPYRTGLGINAALEEISQHKKFIDPIVVETCIRLFHEKGFSFSS